MLRTVLWPGTVTTLLAGCRYADLPDPYPVIWEGVHLEVAAPDDLPICGGTLAAMDDMMVELRHDMGYSPLLDKTRYYYVGPTDIGDLNLCRKPVHGCFYSVPAPTIYSSSIPHLHELAHAVRGPELAAGERTHPPWFFDEGLVHSYELADLRWPKDFDIAQTLRTIDTKPQWQTYEPAAHFISFLDEQYGKPTVVEFIDDLRAPEDWDHFRAVFEQHAGESVYSVLDRYGAYPRCSKFAQTSHPFECSQERVAADANGIIRFTSTIDCENSETIGPNEGTMWRTHVVTLRESGSYRLTVSHGGSAAATRIDITSCEDRCSTAFDYKAVGDVSRKFNLEPGDYLIRVSGPSDTPAMVDIELVPPSRFGFYWCARAKQATYQDASGQTVRFRDPPLGCACLGEDQHDSLLAQTPLGRPLVIPNDAEAGLLDARLAVWTRAWQACEGTPLPEGAQQDSDNCSDENGNFYPGLFYDNLDPQTGNPEPIFPLDVGPDPPWEECMMHD